MLRRRSIRTKLIVALTLLSAIVLLLAISGFWGFYGYRNTTSAIIARSRELTSAAKLHDSAKALQDAHGDLRRSDRKQGMIGNAISQDGDAPSVEKQVYDNSLTSFEVNLQSYEPASYVIDGDAVANRIRTEASLSQIRECLAEASRHLAPQFDSFHDHQESLAGVLQRLFALTRDHEAAIQADIASLSRDLEAHYDTWTTVACLCVALALTMIGILLWSFRSLVVKPFRTLLDGSRLVASGQFDHRIDLGTGDELSELAVAMNEMTDRFQNALNQVNSWCNNLDQQVRDRTREVIQNEQLASVGFLAAGVAHEINNPLATIAWSAESLESRIGELIQSPCEQRVIDDELTSCLIENLRRIEEEAYRCKGITEKLLDFSRLSEVRRAPTKLIELVDDVVSMVSNVGKYRCKKLRVHGTAQVIVHVNPQEIRQVVLNLVTNALESVDTDGAVNIYVDSDGNTASIRITDDGCGMNDEVLKHIFEPFFTRRRDGTGTGLGLSITYRIVSQHGGSLTAHSEGEGRGSTMEVLLPIKPDGAEATQHQRHLGLKHEALIRP